jgi:hypothetical protein
MIRAVRLVRPGLLLAALGLLGGCAIGTPAGAGQGGDQGSIIYFDGGPPAGDVGGNPERPRKRFLEAGVAVDTTVLPDSTPPDTLPAGFCMRPGNDGVICGTGDVCNGSPTCVSGVCTPHPVGNGTPCGCGDSCNYAPTCQSGTCTPQAKPNGGICGSGDSCNNAPTCTGGACYPNPKMDGTLCGSAPDACHGAPTCTGGSCLPNTKPDGTVCAPAGDACHLSGTCTGGTCGAVTAEPDGYNYDTSNYDARCCSGTPTDVSSDDNNCGSCGVFCDPTDGQSCTLITDFTALYSTVPAYYCAGCHASANCWSGCCSTSGGSPYVCSASDCYGNCIACPDGSASCWDGVDPSQPHYCAY